MTAFVSRTPPSRVRLSVDAYMVLDNSGVLRDVGKTELIGGDIIPVIAQHRPHSRARFRLARHLEDALIALGASLGVLVEPTVAMPPFDAPEPDIVVTSEPGGEGPVPLASVALLVVVADTTIDFDLRQKAVLYAGHGVPEYWVVDLNAARIVRMWNPLASGYKQVDATTFGTPLAALTIAGLVVATTWLD